MSDKYKDFLKRMEDDSFPKGSFVVIKNGHEQTLQELLEEEQEDAS